MFENRVAKIAALPRSVSLTCGKPSIKKEILLDGLVVGASPREKTGRSVRRTSILAVFRPKRPDEIAGDKFFVDFLRKIIVFQ